MRRATTILRQNESSVAEEWFRSLDWSPEAREEFERRLSRARPHNRAQYLRIKGVSLGESPDAGRRAVGRDLLQRVLSEYAEDELQAQMARFDLALALEREGFDEDAEKHLRFCVARESEDGRFQSDARLHLAELIVRTNQRDKFDEADQLLDRFVERGGLFAVHRWRYSVARARLASARGNMQMAANFAEDALSIAAITEPDLPRHPNVGLVTADEAPLAEMRHLASLNEH